MDKSVVIHTHTHTRIYIIDYYSFINKNEILPFPTTQMSLMLRETSETQKNTLYYHLYMESKK